MGLLNICNLLDTKTLVISPSSLDPYALPDFIQGENPDINFYLLTRNANGGLANPLTKILPSQYSLRIGIYTTDYLTQLAFQNTFTDDAGLQCKTGSLVYNSANVTAALGASTSVDGILEIEKSDTSSNIIKTYQATISIRKQVLSAGSSTIPPTEVSATQSWTQANFIRRIGNAGDQTIFKSPSGYSFLFWVDDDGQPHFDRM